MGTRLVSSITSRSDAGGSGLARILVTRTAASSATRLSAMAQAANTRTRIPEACNCLPPHGRRCAANPRIDTLQTLPIPEISAHGHFFGKRVSVESPFFGGIDVQFLRAQGQDGSLTCDPRGRFACP